MMRDRGDKEIRFECGLAVVGCDRAGVANRKCRLTALTAAAPDGHLSVTPLGFDAQCAALAD